MYGQHTPNNLALYAEQTLKCVPQDTLFQETTAAAASWLSLLSLASS